jgi:dimethylhistidine N-methyltransferase
MNPSVTMQQGFSRARRVFLRDVIAGLRSTPKQLPCKYFYDRRGSELFDRICQLDDYPRIEILPVCADFTKDFALPRSLRTASHAAVYFPGSTIGNFLPGEAVALLRRITRMCGKGGGLLIGIDLKKSIPTIEAAYNDRLGVTAEFNLNLLRHINRELGADFDLDRFFHQARYDAELGRVEMHLISRQAQTVTLGGETVEFEPGETICTEHSHKYTVDEFAAVASAAGLTLRREWTTEKREFAVLHFAVLQRAG